MNIKKDQKETDVKQSDQNQPGAPARKQSDQNQPGEPAGKQTDQNQPGEPAGKPLPDGHEIQMDESDWRKALAAGDMAGSESWEKNNQDRKKRREQKIRRRRWIFLILLVLAASAAAFLYFRFGPNGKYMDSAEYFMENMINAGASEDVSLGENELAVVLQNQIDARKSLLIDGDLYLNYEMVREYINSRFYWDEENQMLIFTTPLETYEIPIESSTYTIDGEENTYDRIILTEKNDTLYLSADFLQIYTNVEYTLEPDTHHVLIFYQWGTLMTAQVKMKASVRRYGGYRSLILTKVQKEDTVYVLTQMDHWTCVLTADGFIGYLPNWALKNVEEEEITRDFDEPDYTSISLDGRVNLVWHQIDVEENNESLSADTADMAGVNVISPTWFALSDNEGSVSSFASSDYVTQAHEAGLQVWGLVSNFSEDISTMQILGSTSVRRTLEQNLLELALQYDLDGINIDFEAISEDAGYSYVQFMREISILCRKNDLVLSVDVPVPMSFNQYYNRKELGTVCDYVIIMGYDEHYAGSEAGSVASLSFEENGITGTLESVPASKIISGVPFYTRIWYTQPAEDGSISTWSETLGMNTVTNTLETYGVTEEWDEETQQNYVKWELDNGITCQIWVEDEQSLALKAALVNTYDLGGIAEWVLGFERSTVWDVIMENIG